MKFDRISSYQVEGYFLNLAKLQYLRLQDYVLFPTGIFIDGENEVDIIVAKKQSLYEKLHSTDISQRGIHSTQMKISVCLRIARILNTLHSL